ncbi:hypothetical protein VWV82_002362 [Cronobacter malonaticus]|uniref:hypothetical protein n=1 Tax=Cronobacter malonaticus TaxID=413503 RepID=UPI000B1B86A4|nr:hypothetical protein [Cronobacter malonaticus]EKP4390609.1 hypothetical protein [Cronobacter malonaticus]EKY3231217.1 hypothetical protein [Cronobacter malonaticus]ELY2514199.1 hypothetical protein [Cronobacter malonaticus]ELY4026847.1 hypothetical protein [Cronobacter malonaticus]ELY4125849.1 hypothetical protein [Cronobacter malonaticus]
MRKLAKAGVYELKNGENDSKNALFSHRYFRTTLPLDFFTARTAENIPSGSKDPRMIL